MVKRILLALTFVAAFGVGSIVTTDTAEAWRRWGRPRVGYRVVAPRVYYGRPYRGYYRDYYGPRYYSDYYYGPHGGVSVSIGF